MNRGPAALLLGLAAVFGAAGCKRHCWYEWRDEPYIRPVFRQGESEALRRMRSLWIDDREIGARALGALAREARASGDEASARRMARLLMEHYEAERDPQIRATVLAVCLREAGEDDGEVHAFMKSRLACGEHPASAAYGLAALRPPGAFQAISQALSRSNGYELRYELLGALWLLGDARAIPILEAELGRIEPDWPRRVHGMPKAEYRRALAGRLDTLRASCRAEGAR